MDIKALKLELLERIALIDDESRLLALKRLLDLPRGYGVANEKLSVVKESEAVYLGETAGLYSWEEVQQLLDEDRQYRSEGSMISDEELAELDARHAARVSGASMGFSLEESLQMLRARRKK
jgi:hypothetical protein